MNSTGNKLAFISSLATAFYVWETSIPDVLAGKGNQDIVLSTAAGAQALRTRARAAAAAAPAARRSTTGTLQGRAPYVL